MGRAIPMIAPFLKRGALAPEETTAMSMALDEACKELHIYGDCAAREIIAVRIIGLARRGERSPVKLRDLLLTEANDGISGRMNDSLRSGQSCCDALRDCPTP